MGGSQSNKHVIPKSFSRSHTPDTLIVLYDIFDTDETVSANSLLAALYFLRNFAERCNKKIEILFLSSKFKTMDKLLSFTDKHHLHDVVNHFGLMRNGKLVDSTLHDSVTPAKLIERIDSKLTLIFYSDKIHQPVHDPIELTSIASIALNNFEDEPKNTKTLMYIKIEQPKPSNVVQRVLLEAQNKKLIEFDYEGDFIPLGTDLSLNLNIFFEHKVVKPRVPMTFHIFQSRAIEDQLLLRIMRYCKFFRIRDVMLPVTSSAKAATGYFENIKGHFARCRSLRKMWVVMELVDIMAVCAGLEGRKRNEPRADMEDLSIFQITWNALDTVVSYAVNKHHYANDYKDVTRTLMTDERNTRSVYLIASCGLVNCCRLDLTKTSRAIQTGIAQSLDYTRFCSTGTENSILTAMLLYSEFYEVR